MNKPNCIFLGKKNALKKQKIYECLLQNQQMNTQEILTQVNASLKWGLTMNELTNLLSRTKEFEKIGSIESYGVMNKRYRLAVWGINYG